MRILIEFLIISSVAHSGFHAEGSKWSYSGDNGPSFWPSEFCQGEKQSPINIEVDATVYDEYLTDVDPITLTSGDTMKMGNNGHSVYLKPEAKVHMSGAGLKNDYYAAGPHFHWGKENNRGSEHSVDGNFFPLEMHIVTYNVETYTDISSAITSGDPNALAVFGVFFKLEAENNTAFQPIIEMLSSIREVESTEVDVKVSIKSLLPPITEDYYRYQGSLTTPTCNEVVIWTLFKNPVPISQYQMDEFRQVLDSENNPLVNNFRPVQKLNGRVVYRSFVQPLDDIDDGGRASSLSIPYLCVTMATLFSLKLARGFLF